LGFGVIGAFRTTMFARLALLGQGRKLRTSASLALVFLGPVLAVLTFLSLGPFALSANSGALRLIFLADLVYVLVVAALVAARVVQMMSDRRRKSAGSNLHLRLTGVFGLVALIPTILVAVFAVLTVNIGLEGWFSQRVSDVVGSSLAAASAYESEQSAALRSDAGGFAAAINTARKNTPMMADNEVREAINQILPQVQRGLSEVYLIDGAGNIRARGPQSYLFGYEMPSRGDFVLAASGEVVIIQDWPINELRALVRIPAFADRYLFVTRTVDGQILRLLDEAQENVRLYQQLEADRGRVLFNFGLIYLGFALILILAAVWMGMWFAERLSRPVGRLALAAQKVGAGDLDVQVVEEQGDDEIATFGRVFNAMTRQLKGQRAALEGSHKITEARRRLFDSVLSNVTAGVIGLNDAGAIDFANPAALFLLDMQNSHHGADLAVAVPEFGALLDRLRSTGGSALQEEVRLMRRGKLENLLVRMSKRRGTSGGLEGFVVAFDDVTELVSAQRMAAWGDVARRIAHEIKNPLTPIQLSAERIKRKFSSQVQEPDDLAQLTDVIVRQTNDLRRIVDEFSRFARMPEPDRRSQDMVALLRAAILLQENGQPNVRFSRHMPSAPLMLDIDGTMLGQALTNLMKNAGEAIEEHRKSLESEARDAFVGEIRVALTETDGRAQICISDNGTGLPADRARLFEPYVTTREKGTGLGLPIVKKIIEEHGGTLQLMDAAPFAEGGHYGAMAQITLPLGLTAAKTIPTSEDR
jgi:two-component system, NtrC family, nitrogen regulation sensor histidine kinase NtrY